MHKNTKKILIKIKDLRSLAEKIDKKEKMGKSTES